MVQGVPWFRSMDAPTDTGRCVVDPSSGLRGGHCTFDYGVKRDGSVLFQNSWGTSWGDAGRAVWLPEDVQALLDHGAEFAAPVAYA